MPYKNPEQQKQCRKSWYEKNKERARAYTKQWKKEHRNRVNELQRQYVERHKAEIKEHNKQYAEQNRDKISSYRNRHNRNLKIKVLTHYGNGKLACVQCGYDANLRALSIDHINNNGAEHRRELGRQGVAFYRWLITNDYPEGYQTLCMTCQWAKMGE